MTGRILYLHPHFTLPGGAGRYALETGRVLAQRGWDIHIASIAFCPELLVGYDDISFHTLGGPLSNSLWYWPHLPILIKRVMNCIDTLKPDTVFSQVFPANWWGFIAKILRGSNVKHVWMCPEPSAFIHSRRWIDSLPYSVTGIGARGLNPLLKAIDTRLAKNVDYVFANSQFTRQQAFDAYRYEPEKVGISYPGVDTTRFTPASEPAHDHYRLITCARLTKFKNIDRIIRALTLISDERVTLTVIGRGEEYENLVALSRSLNLTERVRFTQTVSDEEMINELRSSYALIHAAEEEPFGLTPVEAMACGTPVIAMRGGGPAETVIHERTGFLCDSASEADIAHGINWMIAQEAKQAELSLACVERAQRFTWEAAADGLEECFQQ